MNLTDLVNECIEIEQKTLDLNISRGLLENKKYNLMEECIKDHTNMEQIEGFYHNYICELYALLSDRVNEKHKFNYESNVYFKRNKKDWRD